MANEAGNEKSNISENLEEGEKKEEEKNRKRKLNASVSDELASNIIKHVRKEACSRYSDARFDETEYYFENGLRKVYPYYFTYTTFCKGRWVGKPLIDVFSEEFRAFTREQYKQNIECGNLMVNGLKVPTDYVLKNNDCITNKIHRHEVGVLAAPVKIIHICKEVVVVDKPPSIPIHPCGRYRHNSLLFILAKEHDLKDLHTIHRLDRLTSGVVILSRTLGKSQDLDKLVREHKLEKEYLCRVEGKFPDGIVTCKEPIEILSPKIGVCHVKSTGKESVTEFERLSFNGKSSVVRCIPRTGRMHQIRVHLQFLGYPIVNDPIYNHEGAFGPLKGKGGITGKSEKQLLDDLMEIHHIDKWLKVDESESLPDLIEQKKNSFLKAMLDDNLDSVVYQQLEEKYKKDPNKFVSDPSCSLCTHVYRDPEPCDLVLFLHAVRYKGEDWEYKTEIPVWAKEDWNYM